MIIMQLREKWQEETAEKERQSGTQEEVWNEGESNDRGRKGGREKRGVERERRRKIAESKLRIAREGGREKTK